MSESGAMAPATDEVVNTDSDMDPCYRSALADARADLAAMQKQVALLEQERAAAAKRARQLRAVIYALSVQLGIPVDLPPLVDGESHPKQRGKL